MPRCKFVKADMSRCKEVTISRRGICRGHRHARCHVCGEQAVAECPGMAGDCGRMLCKGCRCDCRK